MKNITILSIGKPRVDIYSIVEDYLGRIGHYCQIDHKWIKSPKVSDKQRLKREADLLMNTIHPDSRIVLLSRTGKSLSSKDLANVIQDSRIQSRPLVFVIGGADGLDKSLQNRAERIISMSKMTFQHDIALLVLSEQIYRAFTIIDGLPYHRQSK